MTPEDLALLQAEKAALEAAEARWRGVVVTVSHRASVRETAKAAGLSPDTVQRWRQTP